MDLRCQKKRYVKKMGEEIKKDNPEITKIKDFVKDNRFDDAANIIALYLGDSTDENYLNRLEDVIETLLLLHGGRTVLRFLIEQYIIDIPSLLENLSKKDSVLRYSFLLLLKSMCENECDLFLPYSSDLLNSEDPNVREADLQLLVFMAGGEKPLDDELLIKNIAEKLADEKEFVVEKAIQALKAIGKNSPSLVTKVLRNFSLNRPEDENVKKAVDSVLKAIVSIEKIEEIVEEEGEDGAKQEKTIKDEIIDKELALKKKELEIKIRKLDLEEQEKALEQKVIEGKEKSLQIKKELIEKEGEMPPELEELPKKIKKKIKKEESEILDKELELKKKDLEIKKKKIELEIKEKELEEMAIQEKEKALKIKEELLEKESELSQVEIELQQKKLIEKEQKIRETELKRAEEKIKDLETKQKEDQKPEG
jgi:hypothetical protein